MFFQFDYSKYNTDSIVYVNLVGTLEHDQDFKLLTDHWLALYKLKKQFIFVFMTEHIEFVHFKFCFKMAMFIYTLKQLPVHYLNKSIFIIKQNYIRNLLYYIFYLQSPISDIYIIEKKDTLQSVLNNELDESIIYISP